MKIADHVHVENDARVVGDERQRRLVAQEPPRALVAGERRDFTEKRAGEQHGIASAAFIRWRDGGHVLRRVREGVDETVYRRAFHERHVRKTDHGAFDVRRQSGDAGDERGRHSFRKSRIANETRAAPDYAAFDVIRAMTGDDDHRFRARARRGLDGVTNERPAAKIRKQFHARRETPRRSGGEHDCGDVFCLRHEIARLAAGC